MSSVVALMLFAACGGNETATDISTFDPATNTAEASSPENDAVQVETGQADTSQIDEDPWLTDSAPSNDVAKAPVAPPIASPSERQASQSVGAVEPESPREVQAAEPGISADTQSESAPSANPVDVSVPDVINPTTPRFDVPVFGGGVALNEPASDEPAGTSSQDQSAVTLREAEQGSLEQEATREQPSEIGGLDDAMADLESEAVAAETTPLLDDPANETSIADEADDECPPNSAESCRDLSAPSTTSSGTTSSGTTSSGDSSLGGSSSAGVDIPGLTSAVEEADPICETQPWRRGCAGPVPETSDNSEQDAGSAQEPNATGRSASPGVQVPQEIQDILLSPVD